MFGPIIIWIKSLTVEDIQRYTRVGLNSFSTYLITAGMIDPAATWIQPAIGVGVWLATLIWTIYGNRLICLASEVGKKGRDNGTIIITTPEIAAATPNVPNVVSQDDVRAVVKGGP